MITNNFGNRPLSPNDYPNSPRYPSSPIQNGVYDNTPTLDVDEKYREIYKNKKNEIWKNEIKQNLENYAIFNEYINYIETNYYYNNYDTFDKKKYYIIDDLLTQYNDSNKINIKSVNLYTKHVNKLYIKVYKLFDTVKKNEFIDNDKETFIEFLTYFEFMNLFKLTFQNNIFFNAVYFKLSNFLYVNQKLVNIIKDLFIQQQSVDWVEEYNYLFLLLVINLHSVFNRDDRNELIFFYEKHLQKKLVKLIQNKKYSDYINYNNIIEKDKDSIFKNLYASYEYSKEIVDEKTKILKQIVLQNLNIPKHGIFYQDGSSIRVIKIDEIITKMLSIFNNPSYNYTSDNKEIIQELWNSSIFFQGLCHLSKNYELELKVIFGRKFFYISVANSNEIDKSISHFNDKIKNEVKITKSPLLEQKQRYVLNQHIKDVEKNEKKKLMENTQNTGDRKESSSLPNSSSSPTTHISPKNNSNIRVGGNKKRKTKRRKNKNKTKRRKTKSLIKRQ